MDDATRLAYVEVLPDEQKATTVGFLARAVGWFNEQGITCRRILSDNGSAYRSGEWRKACKALRSQSDPHQAVHAMHQRQGRAIDPDSLPGMGLRNALPDLRREKLLATSLSDAL